MRRTVIMGMGIRMILSAHIAVMKKLAATQLCRMESTNCASCPSSASCSKKALLTFVGIALVIRSPLTAFLHSRALLLIEHEGQRMLWKQDNTISTGIIQAIDVVLSAMLILGAIRGVSGHMAPWILFDPGRQVAIFAYGVSEVLFYSGVQLPTPPPPSSSSSSSPPRPPQLTPGWPASLAVVYVCVALLNLFVHRVARKLYKSTMVAEDGGSQEMLQIAEGARYGATKGEF